MLLVVFEILFLLVPFSTGSVNDDFQCDKMYEFNAATVGTVSSPFYGEMPEYPSNLLCEYRITAPKGNTIKIMFEDMDIEVGNLCSHDRLMVYGQNKTSVLGIFCGSEKPNPLTSNSDENEIILSFMTDWMKGGRGFLIKYESSPDLRLCSSGYTCRNRNCFTFETWCNGKDDCGDGTDEENCGRPIMTALECGVQEIIPNTEFSNLDRMVGGEPAVANSWPWQASLQFPSVEPAAQFCGGTLVNAQWVLTATHCVSRYYHLNQIRIHLGAHNKFKRTPYEQIRYSVKVIAFPFLTEDRIQNYDVQHDISLIKLNAPVVFNKGVQPACLPEEKWKAQNGTSCYVTGWGETRGSGGNYVLKQMELTVKSKEECYFNEQTQICVGKSNISPCHGDSGGPLQCRINERWYVFGAASYVTEGSFMRGLCTGVDAKTVYANVAHKTEWIRSVINDFS